MKVLTAHEFHSKVAKGHHFTTDEVDCIVCGSRSIMSGTYMIGCFKIPNIKRGENIVELFINGITAKLGPCPNEAIPYCDFMIFGTSISVSDIHYGGSHLFRELVNGNNVVLNYESTDGQLYEEIITLDDFDHATLHATRNGMRNYTAFVNISDEGIETIFSNTTLQGDMSELTFSGSGHLSPMENDVLGVVDECYRIYVNGSPGRVMCDGTRSKPERRNVMLYADMKKMEAKWMGGFQTGKKPEIIQTLGLVYKIKDQEHLDKLHFTDKDIDLPVVDVIGRNVLAHITYADVWKEGNEFVKFNKKNHEGVYDDCPAIDFCPTGAIDIFGKRDINKCFHCGSCTKYCHHGAFSCDMGEVEINGKKIPIVLRQTDRYNSIKYQEMIKEKIEKGEFEV